MASSRRVALLSIEPSITGGAYTPFSYGVRRLQATLLADPALDGIQVDLLESASADVDEWVDKVEASDADIIGASAYIWSFAPFVEVARRLKQRRPDRTILFGGPSARPAMFALPPFADAAQAVDALVLREGELVLRDIARLPDRSESALRGIPGLALPSRDGFLSTGEPVSISSLDDLASPVRMGLIPSGRTVPVETYRGCPLSCSFCQWGELDSPNRVFSEAYIERELAALKAIGAPSAQLVDAALNLNSRAFKNLAAAEKTVGYFREGKLFTSVYPTHLNESHLEFIHSLRRPRIDVGLQSFNKEALDSIKRPFRQSIFAQIITDLARTAEVEVEIILGLPGDTPEAFRATLDRARELPCRVRVFHCLVLPDALMTRAPASFAMRFDPHTLRMTECLGWSEKALLEERERTADLVLQSGGEVDSDMWQFPSPTETPKDAGKPLDPAVRAAFEASVREATGGAFRLTDAVLEGGRVLASMDTREGSLQLEIGPQIGAERAYRVFEGIAFSYRKPEGRALSSHTLGLLERAAFALRRPAHRALGGPGRRALPVSGP